MRVLLSITAIKIMYLTQFDVCSAFLYGDLEEKVYMQQPEGFNDGTNKVCYLQKSLYGLKQSPRCWNKKITEFILDQKFKQSEADPCLFIKKHDENLLLLALYVDDCLLASNNEELKQNFLKNFESQFKSVIKNPAHYFLGLEIEKKHDQICVTQSAYTRKVLEKYDMINCKPVSTSIVKESLQPNIKMESNINYPYRDVVGALMYLMLGTKPDIAYAVGVVSRKLENPTTSDVLRVKRIPRYLKGTQNYGISYKIGHKNRKLLVFSDADHGGNDETGRSTTGVYCSFAESAISWISKLKTSVAVSSTEAEVMATSEAARELVWLKRL